MTAAARLAILVLMLGGGALALGASAPGEPQAVPPAALAARSTAHATVAPGEFRWPLAEPVEIARPFDLPAEKWLAGHRGVDLRAPVGTDVVAPASGTISFNGWIVDRHVVVIRHGELASTLEPVLSELPVGEAVEQGGAVGRVAASEAWHCPDCLHWGVRRGDQYLDPTLLVNPQPRAVLKR